MSYNGYTNYETWSLCLWMDNDEYLYNESTKAAKRLDPNEFRDWVIEEMLAPYYEMSVEQVLGSVSCAADLIGAALDDCKNDNALARRMNRYGPATTKELLSHALDQVDWEEVYGSRLDE